MNSYLELWFPTIEGVLLAKIDDSKGLNASMALRIDIIKVFN